VTEPYKLLAAPALPDTVHSSLPPFLVDNRYQVTGSSNKPPVKTVLRTRKSSSGTVYQDLGANYYDERKADAVRHQMVNRLERLGFKVTLEPQAAAAVIL